MDVYWDGAVLASLWADVTGRTITDMGWLYYEFDVIATQTVTRFLFISTMGHSATGPTLDDVSLRRIYPPILHRKEQFLLPDHPRRTDFAALTAAEEAAGLYDDTTTIGFKLNWERLLAQKGLVITGHHLRPADAMTESAALGTWALDVGRSALDGT